MAIDWVGFLPAVLLVSLIPGASQLLGLSNAARYGLMPAIAGLAGRLTAFLVLIGLVSAGLGAVIVASTTAIEVIKWVGVAYLVWLGVTTLRRAGRPAESGSLDAGPAGGVWSTTAREFVVALSNPKALLLFAALLPQFTGGPAGEQAAQILVLGVAYIGVEAVVGLGYIGAGRRIGGVRMTARTQRRVDRTAGIVFVAMAGLLAAEDLT